MGLTRLPRDIKLVIPIYGFSQFRTGDLCRTELKEYVEAMSSVELVVTS